MTPRSNEARGLGFCTRCAAEGQFVLAVDTVNGDCCAAHQASGRVAGLVHEAQRRTAERLVAQESAGQLALTDLVAAGARAGARPVLVAAAASTASRSALATPASAATGNGLVETTRRGQDRLALPGVPRLPYATGQQEPCAPCAAAGIDQQGVSRDGPGSPPLCMRCWRGRQQRQARAEQAEQRRQLWDTIGELDAAAAAEEACAACGEAEASPACWLCGHAWLRQVREQFAADQAAEAAAAEAEFERIVALTEAEARVADVSGWIERLQATVSAHATGGGRGRAVELVADLLARLAATRTTLRGRPPVTPYVGAAVAVDSDWRSGRRALPGRERTAWLVGCSDRAVYDGWKRLAAIEWATRVRIGGRNNLERRMETGRASDRAEFDVTHLHRSPIDTATRAQYVPAALELIGELLQHALVVLTAEQDALDELRTRAGSWVDYPEQVRRAQLRAAVARAQDSITTAIPAAQATANICRSHTVSKGEYLSSCLVLGYPYSPKIMIHSVGCRARPDGRREGGASRSSTEAGSGDLERRGLRGSMCESAHRAERPRTLQARRRHSRTRPAWADWAYDLARGLMVLWPWLAHEPLPRVAATLGCRFGPDWTAAGVVHWVNEQRDRPVLSEPNDPLGHLAAVSDESLTGDVAPPCRARRYDKHRGQVAKDAAAAARAESERRRAELDAHDERAAAATGTGREAARAVMARINARRQPSAEMRATDDWPEVAQPGSGLPRRGES